MISFQNKEMGFSTQMHPIKSFVVYFKTAKGLCGTLDEAVEVCKSMDLDPDISIQPVPAAVDIHGHFEVLA